MNNCDPQTSGRFTIRLFGTMHVHLADGSEVSGLAKKEQRLLALLTLRKGMAVDREWLATSLWPDTLEEGARGNLRRAFMHLRDALGCEAWRIQPEPPHAVRLDLSGSSCDVVEFDAAARKTDTESIRRAVDLYSAPLLEPFQDEWAFQERSNREIVYTGLLQKLIEKFEASADHESVVKYSRRLIAADPLQESAHRSLMRSLAASGSHSAAIQAFRDLRLRLREEINGEAAPETVALNEAIRIASREKAAVPTLALPVKGKQEPQIQRLHLPVPLTRIIGRELVLDEIRNSIRSNRLVTLIGVGGVGKTRTALEIAVTPGLTLADGAAFVDLAPVAGAGAVPSAAMRSFGLAEDAQTTPIAALTRSLASMECLIVLDNCEHLPEASAEFAITLLNACPRVRILATSRRALNVMGEQVLRIPLLESPPALHSDGTNDPHKDDIAAYLDYPAMQLFVERARSAFPEFRLTPSALDAIAEICRRLDGIPLAIELAAGRVRGLSIEHIAFSTKSNFKLIASNSPGLSCRQRTLHSLVDWSFQLLDASARALLARLSVFSGDASIEAIAEVCVGGGIADAWDITDLLSSLVDCSLVQMETRPESTRYRMLETIRQFAGDCLESAGETEVWRTRHLEYYTEFAAKQNSLLTGSQNALGIAALNAEHDNMRGALQFALSGDCKRAIAGKRLAYNLWLYRYMNGALHEGSSQIIALLAKLDGTPPDSLTARLLNVVATYYDKMGRLHDALAYANQSIDMFRLLEDQMGLSTALNTLGTIHLETAKFDEAITYFDEALEINIKLGEEYRSVLNLGNKTRALVCARRLDELESLCEVVIAKCRALGHQQALSVTLSNRGDGALCRGDFEAAKRYFDEGLRIRAAMSDQYGTIQCKDGCGRVAMHSGELDRAERILLECVEQYRAANQHCDESTTWINLSLIAQKRGDMTKARQLCVRACKIVQDSTFILATIGCVRHAAVLLALGGQWSTASRLFGFVRSNPCCFSDSNPPVEIERFLELEHQAQKLLGTERFDADCLAGHELTSPGAMALAIEELQGVEI